MKTSKKLVAIFMAIAMLFAFVCPTLADDAPAARASGTNDNSGKITISKAVEGQTYTVYQLLVLESYNTDTNSFSYKAASDWSEFINGDSVKGVYLNVDANGYVTWVEGADAADFAKLAQSYAKENSIDNQGSTTATTTTVEFEDLNLGYYLVDTTLGTLCSLDTTNPEVSIQEKNAVPTIDKLVKEDSDGSWVDANTAQIGDTVEFKTTVHAKNGAIGYVVHDQMSEGLTLDQNSIKVVAVVVKDKDTTETALTANTDYTVAFNQTHGENEVCDFEITFAQTYLDTITADTEIVITYSAILNDKAAISTDTNDNKTKLDYGDDSKFDTEWDTTTTETFKFDIIKTTADNTILTGAKFELYDAKTNGNKINLVKDSDGTYRIATTAEINNPEGFTSAVIEAGTATVKGLDADTTYWLEEIEAPKGYNKLSERVEVKIEDSNLVAENGFEAWHEDDGGVQIINLTGTELPSTGGIGTTVFYIVGSIMCVGAAVLLVTRRRMNMKG